MEPLLMETEYEKPLVLVVDDDPTNLRILVSKLNREYRLGGAKSGTKALEYMGKQIPDLVLLDVMMPDMDGYEATRVIRLSEKVDAADIPIIALTANAFAEDAKAAHDAGMNAHLSKPLDFNKLKNILARIKKNGSVSL